MSEKNYLAILKGGIFASFLILFFVFGSLLFPFISSKQLPFNILIEVLALFWVFFLIKYPKYLPTKSSLTFGLLAYFITLIMSLAVSVDFNMSFWGDIERLLGVFHLLHFLLFYLIIITAFRSKKDYRQLLHAVVISSLLVVFHGLFKKDPASTIGNVAYVAAMMLFAIFWQAIFFFQSKDWWLKSLYAIGILLAFVGLVRANISGSQAGLLAGIFVSILVLIFVSKNKKFKIISAGALIIFTALVASLFAFRSHSIFDGTYLGKALRDFSTENVTLNTRLISYKSAGQYLVDHPVDMIFGVGHGNYALIFDKYFDPKFYDYDRSATYFDRAHNNIIDILTTTGIIGLLAYLSIFFFIIIYSVRAYRRNLADNSDRSFNKIELSLILGLVTAYFVQNLAVFDSFATYLYFMSLLAYINFMGLKKVDREIMVFRFKGLINNFLVPVFILLLFLSFINNINTLTMLQKTISAYKEVNSLGIVKASDSYRQAFTYRTGLERDSRESFINLFLSSTDKVLQETDKKKAEEAVLLAVEVAEKNQSYNIYDSLSLFRLARIYDFAGRFYLSLGDQDKSSKFGSLALDTLERSIENSPGRVPLYLTKANLLLNFDRKDEAISAIEYAKSLNANMPEAYCQLAHFYFLTEDTDKFIENFKICAERGGFSLINWNDFLESVESRYYQKDSLDLLIKFYEIILSAEKDDIDTLSKLSLVYYEAGNFTKARETALRISEIDSAYTSDVNAFLEKLNSEEK
ncbi:MAG: O-antigen ligase family protein [Patescibacteria group bacterium]|nr:O-antigen ligase family protein [Patescibacteria group bacterium]